MLGVSSQTGAALSDIDHLRQSIRDILTTRIGTRVMCRAYGSRLPELVDHPANKALSMDVYAATADALARWEPRFRLSRVEVTSAEPGRLILRLEGVYLPDGTTATLEVAV